MLNYACAIKCKQIPLGELEPGKMIESISFDEATKAKLLHGAALDWLNLEKNLFV